MDISAVIRQLRTYCPALKLVGGAADFARGVETVVNPVNLPAGFVIPDGDDAGDNELQNALLQQVRERVQVIVEFDNTADRRGQGAIDQVNAMKYSIFAALLNWRIDPIRAQRGLEYAGCEFVEMDRGRVWYAFRFELTVSIDDEDGFQQDGPDLAEIDVQIDLDDTFPTPTPEPPVTVHVTVHTPITGGVAHLVGVAAGGEAGQLVDYIGPRLVGVAAEGDTGQVVGHVPVPIEVVTVGVQRPGGGQNIIRNLSADIPAHSTIIVVIYDTGSNTQAPADSVGNTYVRVAQVALNGDTANGCLAIWVAWDSPFFPAQPNGSIQYNGIFGSAGAVMSIFYARNAAPPSVNTTATASGNSAAPTATLAAIPDPDSLIIGAVAAFSIASNTFVQDSNGYDVPPLVSNLVTVLSDIGVLAGGSMIGSSQQTYAPTIASAIWAEIIMSIAPQ